MENPPPLEEACSTEKSFIVSLREVKESTERPTDREPKMLPLPTAKEDPEHGPNRSGSEQTELLGAVTTWRSPTPRTNIYILTFIVVTIIFIITCLVFSIVPMVVSQKSLVGPSCPSCPEDWIAWRGKCYYFSKTEKTWNSSQSDCSSHGASLFVPGPEKELDLVRRHIGYTEVWIGLLRENERQPWKRPDGSVFNSLFEIRANGACAYLDEETARSTRCETERNYVCTKSLPAM